MTPTLRESVLHLVVGQYRTQGRTPVHHRFRAVGQTVAEQDFRALIGIEGKPFFRRKIQAFTRHRIEITRTVFVKMRFQFRNRTSLILCVVVPMIKQLNKNPLRPAIEFRIGSTHLPTPVKAKPDFIQLLAVAFQVLRRCFFRVLPRLNCVLFSGQSKRIVAHRMQHIKAAMPLISSINIRGDVPQRMPYVQSCPGGIRKHIQHVKRLFIAVVFCMISAFILPFILPLFLKITRGVHTTSRIEF